jgi:hypothetical protein
LKKVNNKSKPKNKQKNPKISKTPKKSITGFMLLFRNFGGGLKKIAMFLQQKKGMVFQNIWHHLCENFVSHNRAAGSVRDGIFF